MLYLVKCPTVPSGAFLKTLFHARSLCSLETARVRHSFSEGVEDARVRRSFSEGVEKS